MHWYQEVQEKKSQKHQPFGNHTEFYLNDGYSPYITEDIVESGMKMTVLENK